VTEGKETTPQPSFEEVEKLPPLTFTGIVDKLITNSSQYLWIFLVYPTICSSVDLFSEIIEKFKIGDKEYKVRCLDTIVCWMDNFRPDFERDSVVRFRDFPKFGFRKISHQI